jgi:hypothetical protein
MRSKLLFLIVGFGLLTSGVAYAETNSNYQLKNWVESKAGEVKFSINLALLNLVKSQLDLLSTNNSSSFTDRLAKVSMVEKEETKNSIQTKLKEYETQLDSTVLSIKDRSQDQTTRMVSRINNQTDQLLLSIDSEFEESLIKDKSNEIEITKQPLYIKHEISTDKLKKEIDVTKSVISDLQSARERETNPVVKEYIDNKIAFLNKMITLLEN